MDRAEECNSNTKKVRSLMGLKDKELVRRFQLRWRLGQVGKTKSSIVSNPPKQQVVGTVIPSDCFTAISQSEVLIAITTGND